VNDLTNLLGDQLPLRPKPETGYGQIAAHRPDATRISIGLLEQRSHHGTDPCVRLGLRARPDENENPTLGALEKSRQDRHPDKTRRPCDEDRVARG
jgi:hypothetical protein